MSLFVGTPTRSWLQKRNLIQRTDYISFDFGDLLASQSVLTNFPFLCRFAGNLPHGPLDVSSLFSLTLICFLILDMSNTDLYDLCREFGPLRSWEIKIKTSTFGFVSFMDERDADAALEELDGCRFEGARLRVSRAKSTFLPL